MALSQYVLITAAYNEADYIRQTIDSVVSQTILPFKWIIVSDGSTDATDLIVREYAARYPFIVLVRRKTSKRERDFCSKVISLQCAYARLKHVRADYVGNLDADIVLPPDYYEALMIKMEQDPGIGIASGTYVEKVAGKSVRFKKPPYHTPGSIQFFRRTCFDEIGGYPLLKSGEDGAAGIMARMKGWRTISYPQLEALHLKPLMTGKLTRLLRGQFRLGRADYLIGMHPCYALIKLCRQMGLKPFMISGLSLFAGYVTSYLQGLERPVSRDFIEYVRKEQLQRMRRATAKWIFPSLS
jgi:glycosyltransferase involved in cell wall biosynthesis